MHIVPQDFEFAAKYLNGFDGLIDIDRLELGMAAVIESQTKRRVSDDKAAPDGTPWADWSPAYAGTRHGGHSLLQSSGDFLDDIFSDQRGGKTIVGSSLEYAAIHQFGGEAGRNGDVEIVARPSFGLSNDNTVELEEVLADYLEGRLQ